MTSMITDASPVNFDDPLPEQADVVIIGGGIAGIATAWFLAKRNLSVLVCEKGRIAGEQSSRNWGWIRQQGRDWAELPIMMESNRIWQELAGETGEKDLTFTQCGSLHLAENSAQVQKFEAWIEIARQHQLETTLLTRADIASRYPNIKGKWLGGIVNKSDGRGEPFLAIPALARAAHRRGVMIKENCAVRTLETKAGRVSGVVTEHGSVAADRVLLAGGVWSTHFAANAGLGFPQLCVRGTVSRTNPAPNAYEPNINTPGLTLRRRQDGGYTVTVGGLAEHYLTPGSFRYFTKFLKLMQVSARELRLFPVAPKDYPGSWGMARRWRGDETSPFERMRVLNPAPSERVVRHTGERIAKRYPDIAEAGIAEAWAGMIDATPDAVPVLGEDHRLPGLYLATGLSGHGFGIGPGVGRVMADIMCGKAPGHDVSRFQMKRFFDGTPMQPGPF